MRRNFIILFILPIITSSAFDYKEMLRQDPAMISGEYYHYVYKPLAKGTNRFISPITADTARAIIPDHSISSKPCAPCRRVTLWAY